MLGQGAPHQIKGMVCQEVPTKVDANLGRSWADTINGTNGMVGYRVE